MPAKYPQGWQSCKLRDVISEVRLRVKDLDDVKVLSVSNQHGLVDARGTFARQVHSENISNYKIIMPGQFAYNPSRVNVGSIGRHTGNFVGALSPMYIVFKIDSNVVESEFLWEFILSKRFNAHVLANLQGSVRQALNIEGLKSFPFLIPPKPEQRAIVDTISSLRKTSNLSKSYIQKSEEKQSALIRATISNDKKFDRVRVGELIEERPKGGLSPTCSEGESALGVLKLGAVQRSRICWKKFTKFTDTKPNRYENVLLRQHDFLIIRGNGSIHLTGTGGLMLHEDLPNFECIYPDLMIRLRFNKSKVLPEFAAAVWNLPLIQRQIEMMAKSTNGIWKINQSDIKSVVMPVPSLETQKRIARLNQSFEKTIAREQSYLNHCVELKNGFAQELLSGRVRLPQSMVDGFNSVPKTISESTA